MYLYRGSRTGGSLPPQQPARPKIVPKNVTPGIFGFDACAQRDRFFLFTTRYLPRHRVGWVSGFACIFFLPKSVAAFFCRYFKRNTAPRVSEEPHYF